ncbi:MAG: CNNM domain-containing protein [Phycisphaerae bacterium]
MADGGIFLWLKSILPGYSLWGTLIGGTILVYFYSLYSGCETGLYRVNRLRLHLAYRNRDRRAVILDKLLDEPQVLISVFVVGANICGYLIASMITAYLGQRGYTAGQTEFWTTVILTPIFAVLCETLPKNCFFAQANHLMLRSADFIRISYFLARMSGLAFVLKVFSQWILRITHYFGRSAIATADWDDLGILLRESLAASPFSEIQGDIAERLLELPQVPLSKVIIPLARTFALPMEISRADFLAEVRKHSHSRIPLYEGSVRNIVGIVNVYQVLAAEGERLPKSFLRSVPKFSADQKLLDTLDTLRENSIRMAIVVDRAGSAIGIVTIRDLLDEMFGELD